MPAATTPGTPWSRAGEFQLHLVPSGICWPDCDGIIGNGVVVDPDVLLDEMEMLRGRGIDTGKLHVSERAHVIMPYHVMLDALEEQARGASAIGTTGAASARPTWTRPAAPVSVSATCWTGTRWLPS